MSNATETRQVLTHSMASCFRACPRKAFIRYELGLRPEGTSYPMRFGTAFHAACEADDKGLDPAEALAAEMPEPFDLAAVAATFEAHQRRYADAPLEPVAAELPFDLPLCNPLTGSPSTVWRMAGVIDRIVRLHDGRLALMERKTTSRDFSPGADYWTALRLDQQLSIYVIAARALGYDVSTVLYDVTRRPMHRPEKATPVDERKYTAKASTLKDGTVRPAGSLYAGQRERDETPEEFAARVAAAIAEAPDRYFARIEIARLDSDLHACAADLWAQQRSIRMAQREGEAAWYRNPGACFGNNSACEYLPICHQTDLAHDTPEGFERESDVHPELQRGDATTGG